MLPLVKTELNHLGHLDLSIISISTDFCMLLIFIVIHDLVFFI